MTAINFAFFFHGIAAWALEALLLVALIYAVYYFIQLFTRLVEAIERIANKLERDQSSS